MSKASPAVGGRLIPNPFIKKRNLEWSIEVPPPKRRRGDEPQKEELAPETTPLRSGTSEEEASEAAEGARSAAGADIEAQVARLAKHTVDPFPESTPRLPIDGFARLLAESTGNPAGAHFVIHQHDHPVAGVHYDLRLQINPTSSASFAVPYGLPGDPNSQHLNRQAVETRVHALASHAAEGGSAGSGSMIVWDTGTYAVLPRAPPASPLTDSHSRSGDDSSSEGQGEGEQQPTQQGLFQAHFAQRKIRLRLDGARLPRGYVVYLRLPMQEAVAARARAERGAMTPRRRRAVGKGKVEARETSSSSDDSSPSHDDGNTKSSPTTLARREEVAHAALEEAERGDEEEQRTNAYAGATNTIGSVYQRRWYLSLDRTASGFAARRKNGRMVWEKDDAAAGGTQGRDAHEGGRLSYPFHVRGPEVERSVVSGRLAADVLRDDGVEGIVRRKGWRPILD